MGAKLSDKQRQQMIADYVQLESYSAVAKLHKVAVNTVKNAVLADKNEVAKLCKVKKDENTADILSYMDGQKAVVCEIIGKGLAILNNPEKLAKANPAQITTAIGTLIDKWTGISGGPANNAKEDELSRSLKELGKELVSDAD